MKKILVIILLFFGNFALLAQAELKYEVTLAVDSTIRLSPQLVSDFDINDTLLELPITLHLTNKNYLVMILGNGKQLENKQEDRQSVWLFSNEKELKSLIKNNKNVSATKKFKKEYHRLQKFNFFSTNITYIKEYEFDKGYEIISRNPKPVIFLIDEKAKEKGIELFLLFYVSKQNKQNDILFTSTKKIELKINLIY